jgi:hypothetical protein
MINFQCQACEKMNSAKDEMAGKRAKCECGTIIDVPNPTLLLASVTSGATCMHCQAIIQPHWKGCPACGGALAPLSTPQVTAQAPMAFAQTKPEAISPTIKVGNDSVVKTNLNQSVNVSGQQPNGTAGLTNQGHASSIHVGDGSVVKTEINSTTNISNDNSLNFQGNYVANQTVVQITSTEEMVNLLTGDISDEEIIKIEAQIRTLPNNPHQMLSILALTLRYIIREAKINFKRQNGIFKSSKDTKSETGFIKQILLGKTGISLINTRRFKLCRLILDRLHEIGHNQNNLQIMSEIEKIDDTTIAVEHVLLKLESANYLKLVIRLIFLCLIPIPPFIQTAIALFFGLPTTISYYYISQYFLAKKIDSVESGINNIISPSNKNTLAISTT